MNLDSLIFGLDISEPINKDKSTSQHLVSSGSGGEEYIKISFLQFVWADSQCKTGSINYFSSIFV